MTIFSGILIGYIFAGCVYWLWMAAGSLRIVRALPVLARVCPPNPPEWPKLSIVIPACNEGETLAAAAASVLGQDYPDLEVVLIDDRSTDDTGRLVDEIAAADYRVTPVHVGELPEQWLGKVHALYCGSRRATGEWLLFMDADVHLAPGVLRRAVAYCQYHGLDHLAVVPEVHPPSFAVRAAVAMFARIFTVMMRCWAIDDPQSGAFIGIGAFNLVRRAALDETPGFAWLRLEVADDLGLGMMLKRQGARCCLAVGTGMIGLDWYRSLGEMARGTEKAYATVADCRIGRLLAVCLLLVALESAPWVTLALVPLGIPGLLPPGLTMLAALGICIAPGLHWQRHSVVPGLCTPLGLAVNVALLLRSGWLGVRRGGIDWRGSRYSARALHEGKRVRLLTRSPS